MEMKARCPHDDRLQKLPKYMLKTWITSSSRPPASWTTFKWSVRTNNDAEGWHSHLNHNATHDHLNLCPLVQSLHREAALLPLQVRLVAQRKTVPLSEQEDDDEAGCTKVTVDLKKSVMSQKRRFVLNNYKCHGYA